MLWLFLCCKEFYPHGDVFHTSDKGLLVSFRIQLDCDSISRNSECFFYHSSVGNKEDKQESPIVSVLMCKMKSAKLVPDALIS